MRVFFEDGVGHRTSPADAAVARFVLDTTPPAMNKVTLTAPSLARGVLRVRWSGKPSDGGGAGVAGLRVACCATDGPPPLACAPDPAHGVTSVDVGPRARTASFPLPPAAKGVAATYHYRVCGVDGVGNVSPGATGRRLLKVRRAPL